MAKSQTEAIREHLLNNKAITSMEAFEMYGVTRLSDKIYRLKKQGYDIKTSEVSSKNRYGRPVYFTKYYLAQNTNTNINTKSTVVNIKIG